MLYPKKGLDAACVYPIDGSHLSQQQTDYIRVFYASILLYERQHRKHYPKTSF